MSQRKAWNEAMRNAAGGTLPLPGMPQLPNRQTRKRREKARKAISLSSSSADVASDLVAYRLDVLEEAGGGEQEDDQEEEIDELEEVEGGGRSRGRKGKGKAGGRKRKAGGKAKAGEMEKRFKPRSLASILIEESGRSDGVVKEYIDAEARPIKGNAMGRYPKRKFCPVTGLFGVYTDPKSRIPYANLEALEQLRERHPPWLNTYSGGSAAYHDAIKSLRNED